ncbi:uncharacterized protein LOC117321188 [Pecten maximus]|uniref:uncharacterized protein LOC117321188 n=1 Tax=Pecten maximus TaxID=6579 RepID=UPI00145824E8|nr:uncharacterized protein LOC117321188 [Pecten maximus]
MLEKKKVSSMLKSGLLTPIYKKGDQQNPSNYRGITVTTIILKILEHILNARHNIILDPTQSKLQTGFTKGTSSINSALIVTECLKEARIQRKPLLLTTLDAQKAFDVVDHNILLNKLYDDGITGADWLMIQDLYKDVTSNVKWAGQISEPFKVRQGVRQGGVLSTSHYKRFNNPLLLDIEENCQGVNIGYIRIPHTTCADNIAILAHSTCDMKHMLIRVENYSTQERYLLNPSKSKMKLYNTKPTESFTIYDEPIEVVDRLTHLGINRNHKNTIDIEKIIQIGRKTAYSLMGSGLHGKDGSSQLIKAHLWNAYVVPKLTYGLETLDYTKSQMKNLERFQTKSLRQVQHLPDRTATSISMVLLGIPSLNSMIDRNTLNLFYRVISNPDTIEYSIAYRQLAVRMRDENSWFSHVRKLLEQYHLPTAYALLENPPLKRNWKEMLDSAILTYVNENWKEDISTKPSLKYVNPDSISLKKPHHVYSTVRNNKHDVQRAECKVRLLTGTYTLKANRAAFNQYNVDPECRLCKTGAEDRQHFIAECKSLHSIRLRLHTRLSSIPAIRQYTELVSNPTYLTHLMLDCTHPVISDVYTFNEDEIYKIELYSREFLQEIHLKRLKMLSELDIEEKGRPPSP